MAENFILGIREAYFALRVLRPRRTLMTTQEIPVVDNVFRPLHVTGVCALIFYYNNQIIKAGG